MSHVDSSQDSDAQPAQRPARGRVAGLLLLLLGALALPIGRAYAAPLHGVNVSYQFANPGGTNLVEQRIRVIRETPGQYFAVTLYAGDVLHSYFGLQPDGRMPVTNQTARLFRFSMWNADASAPAPGTECAPFTHEGVGIECALRYPFRTNREYLMRTEAVGADAQGVWWRAWILDLTSGLWTHLGDVRSPNRGSPTQAIQFTESFRQPIPDRCESIRASEVHMLPPYGAVNSTWPAVYEYHTFPNNPCANGSLTQAGSPPWYVLRMGR